VEDRVSDEGEKRAEPRRRALKAGRVCRSGQNLGYDCTVRSLNRIGAGITLDSPVALEGHVVLYFITENVRTPATVIWQMGNRVGLRFARPLDWLRG
jgi:hypothetical protein